ncbi:MAG: hypothetical protein R3202_11780 [Candidatus Competibacterales bacterium]|nr:hypothetical protein [Candidatus Competibacterales bacterium]
MTLTLNALPITAAVCMLISLALAWLASLIIYARMEVLQKIFVAPHQLVRAHIDYLLMALLLILSFYLAERFELALPVGVIALLCIGALYNPLGFIALAVQPALARPQTTAATLRILFGFLPATLGFGYVMVVLLLALL